MSERLAPSLAPRTRRVPFVLNLSHLELVEDVLKETNFNNKDWRKLGQELGVYTIGQEYIYPGNLKECLREWLITGVANYRLRIRPLPTLHELADALEGIGYSEAGYYIIKTYCVSHILLKNSDKLSRIELPDSIVQLLCTKGVITHKMSREMRSSFGPSMARGELREIYAAVDNDHNKLRDFAEILLLSSDTSSLAIDLLKEYYKMYPDTISTTSNPTPSVMRINVSEAYREEFEIIISKYQQLCNRLIDLVVYNVPIDKLFTYGRRRQPDVMPILSVTVSSSDIMRRIVKKCSITNITPLKEVVDHYNITDWRGMIADYRRSLYDYLSKLRVRYLLGSSKDIVNAETIILILDWTPDDTSFLSIDHLLYEAFYYLNKNILVQATELMVSEKEVKLLQEKITREDVMAGEDVVLLQEKITELQKSNETLQVKAEQRKALFLENEKLKSSLENKTRTQQNEEIKDEVNVQPHAMKEGDTDTTQDSELLSTSTESLENEQFLQYSDDVNTQCGIEDKDPQATTKTSDKEVQFNYLVPSEDILDGLSDSHIAGKKLFLVQGDKPQLMDWEEYGLRISVPEGSLSSSETTEIAVIALVGGHFKFPKNTRLVSAVYAISASHLLKSLKLEVQHCIDLSDPSLCKYLKFAVAPVHTSSLPYQFNKVKGGEFPANNRYGSIERSKFCLLCIVGEEKNGGQEQNNGVQQEQSNGHGDSGDEESSEDEGKGGGGNQQGGSGQQQHGGGAEQQGGGGAESGGQEQLQESHREEENERQQTKGEEVHQKRGKEQQQHGSEHHRQPTQEEKEDDVIKAPEACTEPDQSNHSTIIVPDHSTGIPEATVYAGQVFYEQINLLIFTAAKDLNALRKYIKKEYSHAKIDQGITFKLDPSLGYVELIFDGLQSKPTTGWSVHPHMEPCRISELDMVGFEGISNTHPPSRLVTIDVEDNPATVRMLHYSVPLKGALDHTDKLQTMKIVIIRSLKDILSGTSSGATIAPAAASPGSNKTSDTNIEVCAVNALNKHAGSLKRLLSQSESLFRGIADACKEAKMIHSSQLEEIFDRKTGQTLRERADRFIDCILLFIDICPDDFGVFLHILADKGSGNKAFERVAERIAQSFNTEVPDQYHIILTES